MTRLGNFSKPVATINLPKLHTLLGNFCKGVKMFHFSFLGNFYRNLAIFSGHTGRRRHFILSSSSRPKFEFELSVEKRKKEKRKTVPLRCQGWF